MRNATEEGTYKKAKPEFFKDGKAYGKIYLSDLRKMEDITLPNVEETGPVMHSVPVTEAMKESVMWDR